MTKYVYLLRMERDMFINICLRLFVLLLLLGAIFLCYMVGKYDGYEKGYKEGSDDALNYTFKGIKESYCGEDITFEYNNETVTFQKPCPFSPTWQPSDFIANPEYNSPCYYEINQSNAEYRHVCGEFASMWRSK